MLGPDHLGSLSSRPIGDANVAAMRGPYEDPVGFVPSLIGRDATRLGVGRETSGVVRVQEVVP